MPAMGALGEAVTLGRDCFLQSKVPWGGDRAPALGTKRIVTESVLLVFFKTPSFINEDFETLRVWDLPKVTPRGGSGTSTQTSRCHGLDPVPTPQPPLSHVCTAIEALQSTLSYVLSLALLAKVPADSAKRARPGTREQVGPFGEEVGF